MKRRPDPKFVAELMRELLPEPVPPPKRTAEVVNFPPLLSEQELMRRQAVIDQCWERNLVRWRELEAEAARTCHRGPGDPPDWPAA
jgi:hypothetical protein